jgi:hypothetical protein
MLDARFVRKGVLSSSSLGERQENDSRLTPGLLEQPSFLLPPSSLTGAGQTSAAAPASLFLNKFVDPNFDRLYTFAHIAYAISSPLETERH